MLVISFQDKGCVNCEIWRIVNIVAGHWARGVKPQVRNCWGANIYIVNIQQGQNFHPAIISSTTVLTSIMIIGWSCFVIMPHKNSYPNHIFGMFPKHSLLFPESNPWNPTFFSARTGWYWRQKRCCSKNKTNFDFSKKKAVSGDNIIIQLL